MIIKFFFRVAVLSIFLCLTACTDKNITKNDDGSYTVNTIELGKDIRGYAGPLPVSVTIKGSEIQHVDILENVETPCYLAYVETVLLPMYHGVSIMAINNVDAVSGAAYSSRAIIRNVNIAVEYYKNKGHSQGEEH